MDYDKTSNKSNDIIFEKLNKTLEKSNKIVHKKAIALIKGLKETIGVEKSLGIEGIKTYTKNILDLVQLLLKKLSSSNNYSNEVEYDDDLKNSEALIFTLAVCIKQLPFTLLRSNKISSRIFNVLDMAITLIKNQEIKKYFVIILEKMLLSRNESKLQNENDEVVTYYIEFLFVLLEDTHSHEDVQKTLAKSMSRILKVPNMINFLKFSLLIQMKNFLIGKIRDLCYGKDYQGNVIVSNAKNLIGSRAHGASVNTGTKSITTNEGDAVFKFLCSIMQFFPFDLVNDLICELTEVVAVSEREHILFNTLLCFEVAFNTKSFALETSKKIMNILLSKDNLLNADSNNSLDTRNEKANISTSLTISYIKSTTQVLLNISKVNVLVAVKYFNSIISLFGEFLSSGDEFLTNSVFNCLQNMLNNIFSTKNMDLISTAICNRNRQHATSSDEMSDLNPDNLTFEINLTNNTNEITVESIIGTIIQSLLYMTSDRFEDVKPGFNLLYNFIEKINKEKIKDFVQPMIENVLLKLSEAEKLHKNQTFKVFIHLV